MISNIVFDMGNVLADWAPKQFVKQLGTPEVFRPVVLHELFESPEWSMFDAGRITEEGVLLRIHERMAYHVTSGFYPSLTGDEKELIASLDHWIRRMLEGWTSLMEPIEKIQFLPEALKKAGYRVYLLTNASIHFDRYKEQIPCFSWMDGIFVSGAHHLLKPEPEIYRAMLKEFGLKAEETLFIDDNPINVAGGVMCGIEGIVYRDDVPELIRELKRFGVTIDVEKGDKA